MKTVQNVNKFLNKNEQQQPTEEKKVEPAKTTKVKQKPVAAAAAPPKSATKNKTHPSNPKIPARPLKKQKSTLAPSKYVAQAPNDGEDYDFSFGS